MQGVAIRAQKKNRGWERFDACEDVYSMRVDGRTEVFKN